MAPDEFTIRFVDERRGRSRVGLSFLIASLENQLRILRHLESRIASPGSVRWEVVGASMQNPPWLTLKARRMGSASKTTGRQVLSAYGADMRQIALNATTPKHLDEDSLNIARHMIGAAQKERQSIEIDLPTGPSIALTPALAENARQVVSRIRTHYEIGSIEGILNATSVRKRRKVFVTEVLTENEVECRVPENLFDLTEECLGKRVAVSGKIEYVGREPKIIEIVSIRRLRMSSELPQLDDLPRIDITGGLSSEDFIWERRHRA